MKCGARHLFTAAAILLALGLVNVFFMSVKTKTDTQNVEQPSINDVPAAHWKMLAGKKIFFGHQSVGYNVIDGINEIVDEHGDITRDSDPKKIFESYRAAMRDLIQLRILLEAVD